MECWFCEKEKDNIRSDFSFEMVFKKKHYSDRLITDKEDRHKGQEETLVIGRCDDCYKAHKRYNGISLFGIIPATILAIGFFLLFENINENIVFSLFALATVGFGVVVYIRMNYLAKLKIKSLVEMEIRNDDIQDYLADGWYRT